jgi:hypothetical protein
VGQTRNTYPSYINKLKYIDERELSAITGVQVSTLRKWRVLSRGPRFKRFGACVRYSLSDIQDWAQSAPGGGGRS